MPAAPRIFLFPGLIAAMFMAAGCRAPALVPPPPAAPAAEMSVEDELKAAFAAAAKERADTKIRVGPAIDIDSGANGEPAGVRVTNSAGPDERKHLARSKVMEAIAEKVWTQPDKADAYCRAALALLRNESKGANNAVRLAMPAEFLAFFPVRAIRLGAVPDLGRMLADERVIFQAAKMTMSQDSWVRERVDFTLAEMSRTALSSITGYEFRDQEVFNIWWKENGKYEDRLWYWSVRWAHCWKPEDDMDGFDQFPPETGLKILELAGTYARDLEARAPWIREGKMKESWKLISMTGPGIERPSPRTVGEFINKHGLRDLAVARLSGKKTWPELESDPWSCAFAVRQLAAAGEYYLEKKDAAVIEKMLAAEDPELGKTALALTALAIRLDPQRAAEIVLSPAKRWPKNVSLTVLLIEHSGTRHWKLIEQGYIAPDSCYKGTSRATIIKALAKLGPAARPFLRELLAVDPLAAKVDNRGLIDNEYWDAQAPFAAFVEAAKALNGGQSVIPKDLFEQALLDSGGKPPREVRPAHNLGVPAARAEAVRKLTEFFGKPGPKPE